MLKRLTWVCVAIAAYALSSCMFIDQCYGLRISPMQSSSHAQASKMISVSHDQGLEISSALAQDRALRVSRTGTPVSSLILCAKLGFMLSLSVSATPEAIQLETNCRLFCSTWRLKASSRCKAGEERSDVHAAHPEFGNASNSTQT